MPFLKRLIVLYALLIASPAMSDQFREGLRALQLKEDDKAAKIFQRLAADDNRDAQFMLGVLQRKIVQIPITKLKGRKHKPSGCPISPIMKRENPT